MPDPLAYLIRDHAVHTVTREDDGRSVLRCYLRDSDLDRELTPEEAHEWVQTIGQCGGTVLRVSCEWGVKA